MIFYYTLFCSAAHLDKHADAHFQVSQLLRDMVGVAEVLAGELPRLDQAVGGVQQFEHLVKTCLLNIYGDAEPYSVSLMYLYACKGSGLEHSLQGNITSF